MKREAIIFVSPIQTKNLHTNTKQVAQRATIAHLTTSHQNILNSSQLKDFFNWSRAANSSVHGWIRQNFKPIRDYIVVLVTCKNEENLIKIEGVRQGSKIFLGPTRPVGRVV